MVKNDAQGNTVGYQAGRSIDLVRNPNWDKTTDYRPAYVDEIQIDDATRPTPRSPRSRSSRART